MKRVGIEGSLAIADAVRLARVDVIAAYPITPQTHIVERLAEFVANGEIDGQYIPVESEHSAMSACLGSSAVGARTFTATAGVGLELMHEVLYLAPSLRLPLVMAVANRALSGPLSIWGDHSDIMSTRDCGWITIFAENAQDAFDQTLCAFKISENRDVLIPAMVCIDGFHVSHVIESYVSLEQKDVDGFLPPYKYPYPLDPAKPVTIGAFGIPAYYSEVKKSQEVAMRASKEVVLQVWDDFYKMTSRRYMPVEKYRTENVEVLLLTMGSFSETAMAAIDKLQEEGMKVGLIRLRLWRPFPFDEIIASLADARTVIVLDRAISFGGVLGPVCSEIKAAFYSEKKRPQIIGFTAGIGGRDISAGTFEDIILRGIKEKDGADRSQVKMIEVRE